MGDHYIIRSVLASGGRGAIVVTRDEALAALDTMLAIPGATVTVERWHPIDRRAT